jgi:hypothetical protein
MMRIDFGSIPSSTYGMASSTGHQQRNERRPEKAKHKWQLAQLELEMSLEEQVREERLKQEYCEFLTMPKQLVAVS